MFLLEETCEVIRNNEFLVNDVIKAIEEYPSSSGFIPISAELEVKRGFKLIGFFFYETSPSIKKLSFVSDPYLALLPILYREVYDFDDLKFTYLSPNDGMKVIAELLDVLSHSIGARRCTQQECLEKLFKAMELHYCQGVPLEKVNPDIL